MIFTLRFIGYTGIARVSECTLNKALYGTGEVDQLFV